MIKCGHCKGVHETVTGVYTCAMQEQAMIAEAKAQAEIEAFEAYCAEQDYLAEYRAEVGHYPHRDYPDFEAQDGAQDEECPHGLSAWLCADPINHYPADNQLDCW